MDGGGEIEMSDQVLLQNSFSEGLLINARTCTHTHTCNPPGPDEATHTHTCFHTHTQVFAPGEDDVNVPRDKEHSVLKPQRPLGNREAVRRYREKKKAHTAYLEEEVQKLRLVNQQLIKKLQGQAALELEVLRLRGLLLDLRGKIDNELAVFPFPKESTNSITSTTFLKDAGCGVYPPEGATSLCCENDVHCLHLNVDTSLQQATSDCNRGEIVVSSEGNCPLASVECRVNAKDISGAKSLVSPADQVG